MDDRCTDCAASREVAPRLIVERGGKHTPGLRSCRGNVGAVARNMARRIKSVTSLTAANPATGTISY